MSSRKTCSHCQHRLLELKQCHCSIGEFDAVEDFDSIQAHHKPNHQPAYCYDYPCCHLIKRICPCCCFYKKTARLNSQATNDHPIPCTDNQKNRFANVAMYHFKSTPRFDW